METRRTEPGAASSEEERSKGKQVAESPQGGETETIQLDQHTVRFASQVQVDEISPVDTRRDAAIHEETPVGPLDVGRALYGRRMSCHFELMQLPPSRVPSRDSSSEPEKSKPTTPNPDDQQSNIQTMQSPPLTPAVSGPADSADAKPGDSRDADKIPVINEPKMMPSTITPQQSASRESSPPTAEATETANPNVAERQRSDSSEERPTHRRGLFSLGGESGRGSAATSRDASPSRASAYYSRPASPVPDADDPYAASKRPPPEANPSRKTISPRFHFAARRKTPPAGVEKRHSGLFVSLKGEDGGSSSSSIRGHSRTGSFVSLRRMWKRMASSDLRQESSGPPASRLGTKGFSDRRVPFSEDHGLEKWGKFDRYLGSGAGGSVRLLKRDDGTVFAVKEFRPRHSNESQRKYSKKVTSEFCIGSALHHGNVIETLDIIHEDKGDRWYEVMEYAPYDLFSIVMSGQMSREEIACSWLQILNGVTYLHSCGVAHRDLKLDNVVVNSNGIMKIIDFGSAFIFRHNLESAINFAEGVVGSDPYMAPEVYEKSPYDAQLCDIWSLAIIFCCMSLKRFPWKLPVKNQDKSFRLFAAEPSPGHDPSKILKQSKSETDLSSKPPPEDKQSSEGKAPSGHSSDVKSHLEHSERSHSQGPSSDRREVVYGPWRILRLLPRESRYVIWRMLDVNPASRASMDEILADPWVANTVICQQVDDGQQVLPALDHTHTLIEPNPVEK